MTIISTGNLNVGELFLCLIFVCVFMCIISLIFIKVIKSKENSKPLNIKKAKILEKKLSQGNIEWYVVEMEDGERLELRNFNAKKMILSKGDYGTVSYRGKTIVSFDRIKK